MVSVLREIFTSQIHNFLCWQMYLREKIMTLDQIWWFLPIFIYHVYMSTGFSCGSDGKESACNAGDLDSISGSGGSPGGGHGNPLQYSCLKNFMYRGVWLATVPWGHRVRYDWVTNHTHICWQMHLREKIMTMDQIW